MPITRRRFLQSASALGAATLLPPLWARQAQALAACEQGVNLVIVQLEGGNDGTNTIIPLDTSYRGTYDALRPIIGISPSELASTTIGLDPATGAGLALHPHMTGLKALHDSGNLATVLGAHYPAPSLSHFDSENVWYSANTAAFSGHPGWLGQSIGALCASEVQAVPGADISRSLTPLFAGSPQVLAVNNKNSIAFPVVDFLDVGEQAEYRNTFDSVYATAAAIPNARTQAVAGAVTIGLDRVDAFQAVDLNLALNVNDLRNGTQNGSGGFGVDGDFDFGLARDLSFVFGMMMSAGTPQELGLRIFHVQTGGFDRHSNMGVHKSGVSVAAKRAVDFSGERHGGLLHRVDQAIAAFWQDCVEAGLHGNTLIMTFSEFSRRVAENRTDAAAGTDHGTIGPMFVVGPTAVEAGGPSINGGLYGVQPDINDLDNRGNYKLGGTVDFRTVYGDVMNGWLGLDVPTTENILNGFSYAPTGIVTP